MLALPFSALRSSSPVTRKPGNRKRAVPLTFKQWRYAFTNAVPEEEARELEARFLAEQGIERL